MPHPHAHTIGYKVRVTDVPFTGHDATIREIAEDHLKLDVTAKTLTVPITVREQQIQPEEV